MSVHRRSVEGVLDAIAIRSPTAYAWFGEDVDELPHRTVRAMDPVTARRYLANAVEWRLYRDFYCKGEATPSLRREPARRYDGPRWSPFAEALSEANAGRGTSEPGWVFQHHDRGRLVVERHGLRVWVEARDLAGGGDAEVDLRQGTAVSVRLPKELRRLSPGFYVALGDLGLSGEGDEALVRLYWNITSSDAHRLVGLGTARLNDAGVAFQLKVIDRPDQYDRCDAGVVYVRKGDYPAVAPLIASLHRDMFGGLKPSTPAFTKRLGLGLGLAEDPGPGQSFGTHRCLVLAEGILDGHEQGCTSMEDRLDAVVRRFVGEGLDLDAPYLGAGSTDLYALMPE